MPTQRSLAPLAAVALLFAAVPSTPARAQEAQPRPQVPPAALAAPAPQPQPPSAQEEGAEAGDRVTEIRVEGNRRVEAEAVRRALKTRQGEPFDPSRTAEDLKALWALGFFSDVQLLVQRLPEGGVAYVVRVEERPTVREVKYEGNEELGPDDFKDLIDVKIGSILDLEKVRSTARKIQEKYVEKGFFLAEVGHRVDRAEGSPTAAVVFVIRENAKVMVKEIHLLGASKVPEEELKAVMLTKEGGFLSFLTGEGTYREEMFQRDLAAIQAVYYDRGYINVRVDKPHVTLSPDKRYIFISLKVTEGEPFDIGKLDFGGDLIFDRAKLEKAVQTKSGDRFSRSSLGRDMQSLTDLYHDEGYAYVNIVPDTAVNAEAKTVDLTFRVEKGRQVTIERIDVVGNTKTRDRVIRREMRIYEGELFNGSAVRRSKERVTALGFFETVEVSQKPGSRDDLMVLQVEVKEKPTGTFQVGLGFSNYEDFIFTAQISQNNFLGWGPSVSASAQISKLRNLVQLSYYDPYFLDTNYLLSAELYRTESDYVTFLRRSTGGSLSVGYPFLEDVMATVGYTLEGVGVEAGSGVSGVALANNLLDGTTSALRLTASWDRRDNRLFPTSGFIHYGSVEYAPEQLGGTFNFTRYTAYSRLYFPLPLGAVFKTNLQAGYIAQLRSDRPLPISELYFLGGIQSLRGYFLRSISPTQRVGIRGDPDASVVDYPVGGDKQLFLNAELEIPIVLAAGIRGVLFYDAGNVYGREQRFFQDPQHDLPLGVFHSVGFGLRWFSPVGPLRFEWGFPLTRRPVDEPFQFEFNIGNSF